MMSEIWERDTTPAPPPPPPPKPPPPKPPPPLLALCVDRAWDTTGDAGTDDGAAMPAGKSLTRFSGVTLRYTALGVGRKRLTDCAQWCGGSVSGRRRAQKKQNKTKHIFFFWDSRWKPPKGRITHLEHKSRARREHLGILLEEPAVDRGLDDPRRVLECGKGVGRRDAERVKEDEHHTRLGDGAPLLPLLRGRPGVLRAGVRSCMGDGMGHNNRATPVARRPPRVLLGPRNVVREQGARAG
jgi:hypothetical protein